MNKDKVGETPIEQQPPMSTLCKERMIEVIANTQKVNDAAKGVLALLNEHPELDEQYCVLFGIKPAGMMGLRG